MIHRLVRRHQQFHRLITDALAGAASPADRARLDAHLARCAACRERFAEEEHLVQLLHAAPPLQPSRSLRLTPAMVARPARRPPLPAPVLVLTRAAAAASVALFAVVASLTLLSGDDPGNPGTAAKDAEFTTLGAPEVTEGPPDVAPSPLAEPEPGVAPAPGGGATGAGATPALPGSPPDEPSIAADTGGLAPGDTPAPAADLHRSGDTAEPERVADPLRDRQQSESRWPLAATGTLAVAALAALVTVETYRRRRA